jgi:hypothetical protein
MKKKKVVNKKKKRKKRKFPIKIFIIVSAIIIAALILGFVSYKITDKYFKQEPEPVPTPPKPSQTPRPSAPSKPYVNPCANLNDTYQLPNFDELKNSLQNEDFVQDLPSKGSVRLRFFHFVGPCRIWDKAYYITRGLVEEKNQKADIDIWIDSKYADMFQTKDMCEVINLAREEGALGQWSDMTEAGLLWRYKSMLKYRECMGV